MMSFLKIFLIGLACVVVVVQSRKRDDDEVNQAKTTEAEEEENKLESIMEFVMAPYFILLDQKYPEDDSIERMPLCEAVSNQPVTHLYRNMFSKSNNHFTTVFCLLF